MSDKIREGTIIANGPDVLRCIATMLSGRIQRSQFLKKPAALPRQHDLAIALREIGQVERTLFIIECGRALCASCAAVRAASFLAPESLDPLMVEPQTTG